MHRSMNFYSQGNKEQKKVFKGELKITNVVSLNEFMEQGSEVPAEYNARMASQFDSPEENIEKNELKKLQDFNYHR